VLCALWNGVDKHMVLVPENCLNLIVWSFVGVKFSHDAIAKTKFVASLTETVDGRATYRINKPCMKQKNNWSHGCKTPGRWS
jgi:hypothetical protein